MAGDLRILPGWTLQAIGDIGEIVTGKTPSTKVPGHFDGDIPFITPSDMDGRRIISNTARYVTNKGAATVSSSRIPKGAVMVSCIGSDMGKAAIAGSDAITNQQINSIVVHEGICSLYVFYDLSARQREIQYAGAGGSAVPILNKGHFCQLPIMLPPIKHQQAIACILGALDDKIELNRKMNQTLEEMARAIFKSWFVDFDPVRAKAAGHQPPGLKPDIATLFPNRFEDSELGEIPKGWKIESLDGIADFLNGLALQKFPPQNSRTLPVIKIAQLHKGDSCGADICSSDLPDDYIIQDGDVLFSWSGSLEVEIWCGGPGALNQHLFKVTSPRMQKWFYYLWTKHHLNEFRLIAADKATTMGHIQRKHISNARVIIPTKPLLQKMDCLMAPLIEQLIACRLQSRTLSALRDTLLPKLLSGELRVPDAERIVGRCL